MIYSQNLQNILQLIENAGFASIEEFSAKSKIFDLTHWFSRQLGKFSSELKLGLDEIKIIGALVKSPVHASGLCMGES